MMLLGTPITEAVDEVQQFQCEDAPDVESYLTRYARLHHEQNTTHTRLYFADTGELIGFFTVLADLVQVGKAKRRELGWELDNRYNIFPAIKIHYVAVDSRQRNQGCGREIFGKAIRWCKEISQRVGCNFITIEAKVERVSFFQQFGFQYCSRKPHSCITSDGRHVHMCLYLGGIRSGQAADAIEITA